MSENFWAGQSVIVTGGAGFVGRYVVDGLHAHGAKNVFVVRSEEYDLRHEANVRRLLDNVPATMVIHLAATVGGIGANREHPAEYFYDNLMMGTALMHESWRAGIQKFVAIGTICAYPKITELPFREENLWEGYPEETNAPYGLAKKMLLVQSQAYRDEYGFNSIYLLPTNLYGPRDNFDPKSSHVLPALIKKCLDAVHQGASEIEVWGDGSPTREFLHVRDAAKGILLAAERYDGREPVNLGSNAEISIRDLVHLVAQETGFTGQIHFDPSKPNGQPRRRVDTTRAREYFGFEASVLFDQGVRETIAWYREQVAVYR
jgi:GDP-L-fucose synthase